MRLQQFLQQALDFEKTTGYRATSAYLSVDTAAELQQDLQNWLIEQQHLTHRNIYKNLRQCSISGCTIHDIELHVLPTETKGLLLFDSCGINPWCRKQLENKILEDQK